jgi:hypothetical protein
MCWSGAQDWYWTYNGQRAIGIHPSALWLKLTNRLETLSPRRQVHVYGWGVPAPHFPSAQALDRAQASEQTVADVQVQGLLAARVAAAVATVAVVVVQCRGVAVVLTLRGAVIEVRCASWKSCTRGFHSPMTAWHFSETGESGARERYWTGQPDLGSSSPSHRSLSSTRTRRGCLRINAIAASTWFQTVGRDSPINPLSAELPLFWVPRSIQVLSNATTTVPEQ